MVYTLQPPHCGMRRSGMEWSFSDPPLCDHPPLLSLTTLCLAI